MFPACKDKHRILLCVIYFYMMHCSNPMFLGKSKKLISKRSQEQLASFIKKLSNEVKTFIHCLCNLYVLLSTESYVFKGLFIKFILLVCSNLKIKTLAKKFN